VSRESSKKKKEDTPRLDSISEAKRLLMSITAQQNREDREGGGGKRIRPIIQLGRHKN